VRRASIIRGAVIFSASAWIGGMAAGLFALFLSTLGVEYFFVPPFYSFSINATDTAYFGAFIVCALVASWVSASKKKSEEALTEARSAQVSRERADRGAAQVERRIAEKHRGASQGTTGADENADGAFPPFESVHDGRTDVVHRA
jgi:K+-sensing histidine kinase KdpD